MKRQFLLLLTLALNACATHKLERTPINPWPWGGPLSMHQAEVVSGAQRTLYLSGQAAMDAEGSPVHAGDLRAQWQLAFDNLERVLADAGMQLSDVVRLVIYTTDIKATTDNWDLYIERIGRAGIKPPQTLVGVQALAYPELMIELEATAVQ
jgi:enamine deaminase RidA (YjgF/YER057c/UK114 family)